MIDVVGQHRRSRIDAPQAADAALFRFNMQLDDHVGAETRCDPDRQQRVGGGEGEGRGGFLGVFGRAGVCVRVCICHGTGTCAGLFIQIGTVRNDPAIRAGHIPSGGAAGSGAVHDPDVGAVVAPGRVLECGQAPQVGVFQPFVAFLPVRAMREGDFCRAGMPDQEVFYRVQCLLPHRHAGQPDHAAVVAVIQQGAVAAWGTAVIPAFQVHGVAADPAAAVRGDDLRVEPGTVQVGAVAATPDNRQGSCQGKIRVGQLFHPGAKMDAAAGAGGRHVFFPARHAQVLCRGNRLICA